MPTQFPALQQRGELAKFIKLALDFSANETLDPRITFSRTSNATRVNAQGLIEYAPHNLLTYSEQFDNASWVKGAGVTVTPNATASPDGTLTADLIASPQDQGCYENLLSVGAGITVTNSIYIKAGTATQLLFRDDLGAGRHLVINPSTGQIIGTIGTIISSGSISVGNGWYRYYMTYVTDSANCRNLVRNDTAGTLTYYTWGAQLNIGSLQPYYTTSVKNLLGYSQEFSNATWTKSNSTIDATPVMGPFGYFGAMKLVESAVAGEHNLSEAITYTAGTTYTLSVYAKAGERNFVVLSYGSGAFGAATRAYFNLAAGTVGTTANSPTTSIVSVCAGWYRCSITKTATVSAAANTIINETSTNGVLSYMGDGSSGIYIYGAQLSDSASLDPYVYNFGAAPTSSSAYYGPRFDYDPVTLAPKGLLIEEARTNLIKASENLSAVTWNKTETPVLDSLIQDPSGNINTVYYPTISEIYQIFDGAGVSTISLSFFGKKREGSSNNQIVIQIFQQVSGSVIDLGAYGFSLITGNPDSTYFKNIKREQYQNGWYRFSCQIIANTGAGTGNFSASSRIDIEGGLAQNYVWGIQIELNAFPTSYIPTTSAQVTRTADNASMVGTNFSSWYNQSEGTIYSEWILGGDNISNSVYSISDGSASNLMRSRYNSAGTGIDNAVITSGATVAVLNATNQITTYSSYKNAMAYLVNDFARAANTVLVTDNSGAIPTVNQINIGASVGAVEQLNGHIKTFKFFSKRFINTYLESLTQ